MSMSKEDFGRDGKKTAVDLLPEELWDLILLRKLTDPWDRLRCYDTCSLYRKLLGPWKEDYLQNHPSLRPHQGETHIPKLLPFVSPLEEKGLIQQIHFDFDWVTLPSFRYSDPDYVISTFGKLLVGRLARFTIRCFPEGEDGRNAALWTKIDNFLELFGSEIWYLSVQFNEPENASRLAKERMLRFSLHDVFQLVPNIRKLSVLGLPDEEPSYVLEFSSDSLPDLHQLETLEFWFAPNLTTSPKLTNLLRRYHDQIGRLSLSSDLLDDDITWPRLTEYRLRLDDWDHLDSLTLEPEMMQIPNLTKLVVQVCTKFHLKNGTHNEDFYALLRPLKVNFLLSTPCTKLTTLRIKLSMNQSDGELNLRGTHPMSCWKSSRLTTLELELGSEAVLDYQFLGIFHDLENLNVFYRKPSQWEDVALLPRSQIRIRDPDPVRPSTSAGEGKGEEEGNIAKLVDDWKPDVNDYLLSGELYESNIWEWLPKLKVFTFQWDVYTREGYEDYCRIHGRKRKRVQIEMEEAELDYGGD